MLENIASSVKTSGREVVHVSRFLKRYRNGSLLILRLEIVNIVFDSFFLYLKRSKHCTEPYYLQKYMKLLKHQATTISLVSALQTKLSQAQSQFLHLEANYNSCKTRFQHLMRNIIHQRNSEKRRVHTVISTLREALTTERRNREKIESSAKRIMQEYEKEKRGKEMAEEVCRELAKIIAEDEMELEGLKREAVMIREERRMYELAEIWREERAQMKMVDAKLALECKLDEMNKLVSELERFLGSQASALMSTSEIRKGEMIRQAIRSLDDDDDGSNYQIVAVVDDQSGLESRNHKRPDSENPHVIRGMKGFVEWPRCNKRKSQFKSKLFKTLLKSQKSRFCIVLNIKT